MQPIDDRTAELCAQAALTVAGVVDAIRRDDREALMQAIGALLNVVNKLARTRRAIADEALANAVSRLP